jgi:hypothetical protein
MPGSSLVLISRVCASKETLSAARLHATFYGMPRSHWMDNASPNHRSGRC